MGSSLSDTISALSVMFGVAAFHLNASWPRIQTILELEEPDQVLKHERASKRRLIIGTFFSSSLPSLAMLAALLLVITPTAIKHLNDLSFSLFQFDLMTTLFQIISAIIVFYFSVSLWQALKLIQKWFAFL